MTTWSNNKKVAEADECSFCGTKEATFILTDELLGVIAKLCEEVKTEWQALLIGEEREDNVVYMCDYYIPKQTVTSASVINNECFDIERIQGMGIIGGIHSHGNMNPFFSATDHDCTNTSPIKNNIVVNNNNEFVATKAITLPCGMVKFLDAKVTREMPDIIMPKKVIGVKHIEQRTYSFPQSNGLGAWRGHGGMYDDSYLTRDYPRYGEPAFKGTRKKHGFDFEEGGKT